MAGRFASDDRGSRDGRGRTGAARAPLHRWLAVPVGLRARTAVERGASCGSSASVVGTDADAAAVADACLGETSSRHPVRGVHDAAARRWVLVSARAARRSRGVLAPRVIAPRLRRLGPGLGRRLRGLRRGHCRPGRPQRFGRQVAVAMPEAQFARETPFDDDAGARARWRAAGIGRASEQSSGSFAAFLRLHRGPSSQETVKKPSP